MIMCLFNTEYKYEHNNSTLSLYLLVIINKLELYMY